MSRRWVVSLVVFLAVVSCGCGQRQDEPEQASPDVAVHIGTVTRATLHAWVDGFGTIEGEPAGAGKPAGAARLSTPVAGVVTGVQAREGERVEAGTVIVKLEDGAALAQLRLAEQQMERQRMLESGGGASEKAVQEAVHQLAAARAQLALVHLASPIAGIVARIHVQPGQTVDPTTVVAEVIDPARLAASVQVSTREAASVELDQPAVFLASGGTGAIVGGRVSFVSPVVDARTDSVMVRVSVPQDAAVRAGQFVKVRIMTDERRDTLAVPRDAVYTAPDGRSTLSIVSGGVARQTVVKTGLREGDLVEVEGDGVTEGATVVTLGSYDLPASTKVRIVGP
jgi:membrane fusion protein (multidrug efflux system)